MAATDEHYNVRLLDLATLEWIGTDAHIPGDHLTYAPDGSQFAALQADRIRVWDGRSGDYQASLALPADLTADPSISYLPDSSGLLVTANDGRTWTVNTRISTWAARACRIAGRNLTQAEWQQFFPGSPYRLTCPQWPAAELRPPCPRGCSAFTPRNGPQELRDYPCARELWSARCQPRTGFAGRLLVNRLTDQGCRAKW